jgi:hypothetical protein
MEVEKYNKDLDEQFKSSDASLINDRALKSDMIVNIETKINQSNNKNQS